MVLQSKKTGQLAGSDANADGKDALWKVNQISPGAFSIFANATNTIANFKRASKPVIKDWKQEKGGGREGGEIEHGPGLGRRANEGIRGNAGGAGPDENSQKDGKKQRLSSNLKTKILNFEINKEPSVTLETLNKGSTFTYSFGKGGPKNKVNSQTILNGNLTGGNSDMAETETRIQKKPINFEITKVKLPSNEPITGQYKESEKRDKISGNIQIIQKKTDGTHLANRQIIPMSEWKERAKQQKQRGANANESSGNDIHKDATKMQIWAPKKKENTQQQGRSQISEKSVVPRQIRLDGQRSGVKADERQTTRHETGYQVHNEVGGDWKESREGENYRNNLIYLKNKGKESRPEYELDPKTKYMRLGHGNQGSINENQIVTQRRLGRDALREQENSARDRQAQTFKSQNWSDSKTSGGLHILLDGYFIREFEMCLLPKPSSNTRISKIVGSSMNDHSMGTRVLHPHKPGRLSVQNQTLGSGVRKIQLQSQLKNFQKQGSRNVLTGNLNERQERRTFGALVSQNKDGHQIDLNGVWGRGKTSGQGPVSRLPPKNSLFSNKSLIVGMKNAESGVQNQAKRVPRRRRRVFDTEDNNLFLHVNQKKNNVAEKYLAGKGPQWGASKRTLLNQSIFGQKQESMSGNPVRSKYLENRDSWKQRKGGRRRHSGLGDVGVNRLRVGIQPMFKTMESQINSIRKFD